MGHLLRGEPSRLDLLLLWVLAFQSLRHRVDEHLLVDSTYRTQDLNFHWLHGCRCGPLLQHIYNTFGYHSPCFHQRWGKFAPTDLVCHHPVSKVHEFRVGHGSVPRVSFHRPGASGQLRHPQQIFVWEEQRQFTIYIYIYIIHSLKITKSPQNIYIYDIKICTQCNQKGSADFDLEPSDDGEGKELDDAAAFAFAEADDLLGMIRSRGVEGGLVELGGLPFNSSMSFKASASCLAMPSTCAATFGLMWGSKFAQNSIVAFLWFANNWQ